LRKLGLLLLLTGILLQAADRAAVDQGIRHFKRGAYDRSLQVFRDIYDSESPETNVFAAISLFMIIRSENELGNNQRVVSESRRFEKQFPSSRYLPDVRFERAKALTREQQYLPALLSAISVLSSVADEALKNDVRSFCNDLSRYYMNAGELAMIEALVPAGEAMEWFTLLRAEQALMQDDPRGAETILQSLEALPPASPGGLKLQELEKALVKISSDETGGPEINIAVALPLSGRFSDTGNELLDGIKLAYEMHRKNSKKRYNMIIVDTESDVRRALVNLRELLAIQRISAVLGPLNSDVAVSMAPICEYAGVPLITPAATADDLTRMGNSIFQLNPEQKQRAESLADYSTDSLKYRRFAIVAPADDYGMEISGAFSQRVERNGGQIVQQVWYNGTPTDINDKLAALKNEAEYLPAYFSYLNGFYKARAAGFFNPQDESAIDSAYTSALDSIFTDTVSYSDVTTDSVYAIHEERADEPDTTFLLETLWPDDPGIYGVILRSREENAQENPDSLIRVFIRHSAHWLSPEITLEEKYRTLISDSICILLDAVERDTLPSWIWEALEEYRPVPIPESFLGQYSFAPLREDIPLNVPYIDLKFVDSLKIELTNMDSISALWLLAKTDTVLFPYLFPFEKYGIDAVYMPIPQNHIQYLAPQWANNRFKTQLLGDGNWYNTSLLERYKSNIDSMIIASDYYWDSRDLQLRRFAKNFTDKTGLQPNRIHIYGYESMDLLMTLIEKGSPAAKDIQDQLLNLEDQHGIIRKITFKPEKPRSSSGVRLIRFYKGKISLIQ